MRFFGDLFILHRNPFLLRELIDSPRRRRYLFKEMYQDLDIIRKTALRNNKNADERTARVLRLVDLCRQRAAALRGQLEQAKARQALIRRKLGAIVGPDNVPWPHGKRSKARPVIGTKS